MFVPTIIASCWPFEPSDRGENGTGVRKYKTKLSAGEGPYLDAQHRYLVEAGRKQRLLLAETASARKEADRLREWMLWMKRNTHGCFDGQITAALNGEEAPK